MTRLSLLVLLTCSFSASAIVIRDDTNDSKYRVPASEFSALVDMPGEGHGVLIAPQPSRCRVDGLDPHVVGLADTSNSLVVTPGQPLAPIDV